MSISGLVHAAGYRTSAVLTSTDFDSVKYTRSIPGGGDVRISISDIQLALPGGGLTELDSVFFRFIMEMMWSIYTACVWIVSWFANFAMGLGWLNAIRAPFDAIQDVLQEILRNYNLYATMLVITAFICVIWMARGRWAQGIAELFLALIITNYAIASIGATDTDTTPLAAYSPLDVMLGGDDGGGLIYESRDFGTDIVGQLDSRVESENEADESQPEFDPMTPGESIVTSFIWYPVQLVNFGEILVPRNDNGEPVAKDHPRYHDCQDAYALVLAYVSRYGDGENGRGEELAQEIRERVPGPYGERAAEAVGEDARYLDEGWKVPGACVYGDEDKFENQANLQGVLTQWFLGPTVGFLGLVVLVIAGAVVLAGVNAIVQCFKVLLALLVAILPMGARRSLWVTIGSAATALLTLVFAIIFLGTFMVIIQYIFGDQAGNSFGERIGTFMLVDVLLVIGLIIFWRGRKAVSQSNEKMAEAMSKMTPGGGGGGGFGKAANSGGLMAGMGRFHTAMDVQRDFTGGRHLHSMMRRRREGGFSGPGSVVMSAGSRGRSGGAATAAKATGGAMVRAGAIKGAKKLAGTAALGFVTGGSSLVAQGGAAVAKSGALKAAGKGLAAAGGRSARWVGNRGAWAIHSARNNWDRANRAQAVNRQRKLAHAKRWNNAKLRWHDANSAVVDVAARATNGRFGTALKAEQRSAAREDKVKTFRDQYLEKKRDLIDKDNKAQARMTPAQRQRHQAWREHQAAKINRRNARRRARERGGFG